MGDFAPATPAEANVRFRIAATVLAAFGAAAIAAACATWFIDSACNRIGCDFGALQYFGLFLAWPPAAGVIAGRLAWRRTLGGVVGAGVLLAWFIAHLVAPVAFLYAYRDLLGLVDHAAWVLLIWLGMGAVLSAMGWFGANVVRRPA